MELVIDSRTHFYSRTGSGDVVLFVHGITTYSFIWRRVIPFLEQSHDCIAIDLQGCGQSDLDVSVSFGLSAHADRLAKFIQSMGFLRVHLVAHDLGGGIAQIMAVRYPELLIDVSILNSVGYDYWPVQPIIALRTPIVRELIMATLDFGTFQTIVKRGIYHKDRVNSELMSLFQKPMGTAEGRKAFLHFAKCLDNHDLTSIVADLQRCPLPFLILRGDADVYLSSAIAERLASDIPNAKLARIASAGHFMQEDEPEWIAKQLKAFWESK